MGRVIYGGVMEYGIGFFGFFSWGRGGTGMRRGSTRVRVMVMERGETEEGTTTRVARENGVRVTLAIEASPKLKSLFDPRGGGNDSAPRRSFGGHLRGDPKNQVEVKKEANHPNFVLNSPKKAEGGGRSMHIMRM